MPPKIICKMSEINKKSKINSQNINNLCIMHKLFIDF